MLKPEDIISEEEVLLVLGKGIFVGTSPRQVVNKGLIDTLMKIEPTEKVRDILIGHKLIRKKWEGFKVTKKGYKYARSLRFNKIIEFN